MTAQPGRYVPLFASEKLLEGFDGQPPYLGCGIATDIICTAWATLGESQIQPNGRPFDTADFTNQLKVGWRAFEKVRDANGMPDRDDVPRIHKAMFPGLPLPEPLTTNDFDQVVELLRSGDWVVSFAGSLANVGLPLAKYTRAPHQFPVADLRAGKVIVQDPMHPPSLRWPGHRVPLAQVEKAGRDLPDRTRVLAWKYPVGGWRAAVQEAEALRDRLRDERDKVVSMSSKVEGQTERIERLQAALEACRDGQGTDCSGPIAAALETERIAIRELVDDRRSL
jgi:hypothetical protein